MKKNLSTKELGFSAPQNEQIEMALTYGFTSIDLDITEFGRQVQSRGMEVARRLIDSAKIAVEEFSVGTFRLPFSLDESDAMFKSDMQRLPALARAAKDIEATRAIARVSPFSETQTMVDNYEFHRQRLAEIQTALTECDIMLGLEFVAPASAREGKPHEFVHTLDELMSLVDSVPNVGVVIDTWQLYASGADVAALAKVPVEKIVGVKLGDAPADIPADQLTMKNRLLPEETGAVPCADLLKKLEEMGYDGPVTSTCDAGNLRGERRDLIAEIAGSRMRKLWIATGMSPPEPEPLYVPEVSGSDTSDDDAGEDGSGDDDSGDNGPGENGSNDSGDGVATAENEETQAASTS